MKISVVSPVYKAENIIDDLINKLLTELGKITTEFEILLVEDCGPDRSWEIISEHCRSNPRVRGIKLSRNFGQHYAITAGLDHAKGDWVIVMDCDLQDRPEEISKLYSKAQEGYDIVLARRVSRQDGFFKKTASRWFYKSLAYLSGSKQDETIANFGIYSRKVINAVSQMRESVRYFPTMIKWVGFKRTAIDVEHGRRPNGGSSYNLKKLFNLALDIVLAYSDKPLRETIKVGLLVSLISFLCGLYTAYQWLFGRITVVGYTSLILSIWFLSGLIIAVLGIVGLYVGKTYEGIRNRPIYLVDEIL